MNLTERMADMEAEIKRLQVALDASLATKGPDVQEGTTTNGI
jgi:hypothetical protein